MKTRLLGEHFRPDGKPKQSYRTEVKAYDAAKLHGKTYYRCSFCGKWHIGKRQGGRI